MQKLFGTDGIRGVAGAWPLDAVTVARIGAALVRTLPQGGARIVVGRDTRESGEWIERELARGATGQGAMVVSAGVVPTPAIAYLAGALDFDLGVVLSASHNAYADNGIKVFSGHGQKFGEREERAVESIVADMTWTATPGDGLLSSHDSLVDEYLAHTRRLLPSPEALRSESIAVDMANGATTATAAQLFEQVGVKIVALGDRPDGRNINRDCGSLHPAALAAAVRERGCLLGVAFDGDGDRAIFVDREGRVVDGDAILLILALAYQGAGRLTGNTVVATVMSNIGLELALGRHGIGLIRTPVGDKYVMDEMLRGGYVLGGEQSGHVILKEHLPTGDGLATTLAVLRVMAQTGRDLGDLASELVTYPQTLVNVRVREKTPVDQVPAVQTAIARVERAIDGRGRVLVRYSGTEPLLRIMIEGDDQQRVTGWAEEIAQAVRDNM